MCKSAQIISTYSDLRRMTLVLDRCLRKWENQAVCADGQGRRAIAPTLVDLEHLVFGAPACAA